ncbi:MAG: type II secretion system protein GspE, partial [Paracoccaceae bacterium]
APMLVGVVAQRLVRRLCVECRRAEPATAADAGLVEGLVVGEMIHRAVGCAACHGQGYRGRSGIYEVVAMTRRMEAMIGAGATEAELTDAAREEGPGLIADGLRQIRAGVTTVEDVARVAQES